MNGSNQSRPDPADLLGYHLGIADEATRGRVEAAFGDAESLAAARASVERFVAPLALDEAGPPPPDLADRIMGRIGRSGHMLRLSGAGAEITPDPSDGGRSGRPLFTLGEVAGLAAAIALFVGIFVPGYRTAQRRAIQTACMNNMRDIGTGYVAYAEDNGNFLPYAGAVPSGAVWLSTARTANRPVFSNSQNAFKLVRRSYVPPESFICPGRPGDVALKGVSFEHLRSFPERRNNSYSPNLVLRPWRRGAFVPQMPILSDMNPMAEPGGLMSVGTGFQNSLSHDGRGQNVLRADISIIFGRDPRVGIDKDDIFRIVDVDEYTGMERPQSQSDAFMVP